MKPFAIFCLQAANGAAPLGTLVLSPSVTCLVVQPWPWSGSIEADPVYQTCSFRGFCHHMADPGPATSPGGTCAWIRVKISGYTSVHITLSILGMTTHVVSTLESPTALINCNGKDMFITIVIVVASFGREKEKQQHNGTIWPAKRILHLWTTIPTGLCGRCTFQLLHFSSQCPDILNMLSPVVSMLLHQYLHAFCPQRQQKRSEKKDGEKSQQFFTLGKAVSQCVLHLCTLPGPPSLSSLVPLASWRAE